MSDPFDIRIRSFVVELLDDPPAPPPFPQAGAVVIRGDRTDGRESMREANRRGGASDATRRRRRGPLIAATAFAAVVVIGAVVGVLANIGDGADKQPVAAPQGAAGVVGSAADTLDGPGTEPDRIVFNEDGTYEVIDQLRTVDTGVYTTNGDEITFESDATDAVRWFFDDINHLGDSDCAGVVGTYTLTWESSTRFALSVISDACPRRITVANHLALELVTE